MISIINTVAWMFLSVAVIFFMSIRTNKEILKQNTSCNIDVSENEKQPNCDNKDLSPTIRPYSISKLSICTCVLLTVVSGVTGYIVSMTGTSVEAVILLGISYLVLLGAAIIDYKLHIIPNYFPLILVIARVLCLLYEMIFTYQALEYLISSLIGCFACFLLLMIAGKISKGGIGYGDVKLLSALGFACGLFKVLTSLIISLIICLIVSLIFVALKKKTIKDHMSFGPFIYFGFLIVLIFNFS